MPSFDDKNESADEEMDEDTPVSDKSDDDDFESGTGSEGDGSSGDFS